MPFLKSKTLQRWKRAIRRPAGLRIQDVTLFRDRSYSAEEIDRLKERIDGLRPWFHNFEVASGVWTDAGNDGPGWEYLSDRWRIVDDLLPDVSGKMCLDVGCSSGFFSFKLADAGASTIIAVDDGEQTGAVSQARLIEEHLNRGVNFQPLSIYDLGSLDQSFDIVLCLGVFYHLRHPLLAIEALRSVCTEALILQTVTTRAIHTAKQDSLEVGKSIPLQSDLLLDSRFPALRFIESTIDGDGSCWFIPNAEAVFALLRAGGFHIERYVTREHELFVLARPV